MGMDKLQAPQPTNCIRQLPQPGATMSLMLLREGGQFTPICLLPHPEAPTYSASLASTKPCSDRLKIGNHLKLMNTHTVHGPPVGQANSFVGPLLLICHIVFDSTGDSPQMWTEHSFSKFHLQALEQGSYSFQVISGQYTLSRFLGISYISIF